MAVTLATPNLLTTSTCPRHGPPPGLQSRTCCRGSIQVYQTLGYTDPRPTRTPKSRAASSDTDDAFTDDLSGFGSRSGPTHHDTVQTAARRKPSSSYGTAEQGTGTCSQRLPSTWPTSLWPGDSLPTQKSPARCLLQRSRSSAGLVRSPAPHRFGAMSQVHTHDDDTTLLHQQHWQHQPARLHDPSSRWTQSSVPSSPHSDSHDRPSPSPSVDRGPLPQSPEPLRPEFARHGLHLPWTPFPSPRSSTSPASRHVHVRLAATLSGPIDNLDRLSVADAWCLFVSRKPHRATSGGSGPPGRPVCHLPGTRSHPPSGWSQAPRRAMLRRTRQRQRRRHRGVPPPEKPRWRNTGAHRALREFSELGLERFRILVRESQARLRKKTILESQTITRRPPIHLLLGPLGLLILLSYSEAPSLCGLPIPVLAWKIRTGQQNRASSTSLLEGEIPEQWLTDNSLHICLVCSRLPDRAVPDATQP